jgi:hypothetical protein
VPVVKQELEQTCPLPLLPPLPAMRHPAYPPLYPNQMEALPLRMPRPQTGAFPSTP